MQRYHDVNFEVGGRERRERVILFFFQAEDGIRDVAVTGVQTCALPIYTAFMQPQMVLIPTDLSGLRDRNMRVQLTPEQWRLFTVADGKTSLQTVCQQLVMSRELVCQVAGELVALSLVTVSLPVSGLTHDSTPFPQNLTHAGFSNSYVTQAHGSGNFFSPPPVETHSQWGNGGTGATFVLGNGWVVASSPSLPSQSSELYNASRIEYAEASGIR